MGNMFRCTLASGGALILTVTCDSAFAGQTITCTDGTTTLTQICPSTSPYTVEFKIPNVGTWTISSGINSTSVTIPSTAVLHTIPNGSTVTPTDDIQTWLHCANIWNINYTTISQVLADASTLQALIASNNAADYMARSTAWASDITADQSAMSYIGLNDYCADALLADSTWLNAIGNSTYFENVLNVKVPTMTSNTTPSGVAFASREYSDEKAWKAFANSVWTAGKSVGFPQYLGYEFASTTKVYKAKLNSSGNRVTKVQIQGSNDNFNTDITNLTEAIDNISQSGSSPTFVTFSGQVKSRYRIKAIAGSNSDGWISLQRCCFYGRTAT